MSITIGKQYDSKGFLIKGIAKTFPWPLTPIQRYECGIAIIGLQGQDEKLYIPEDYRNDAEDYLVAYIEKRLCEMSLCEWKGSATWICIDDDGKVWTLQFCDDGLYFIKGNKAIIFWSPEY